MKRLDFKAGAMLSPLPAVMVTVGNGEESNVLTVAWTGILSTDPPRAYISVRPGRYSHKFLEENGEFVINLTTEALARTTDYVGVYTGKKVDKFEKCRLTAEKCFKISAPAIAESPLTLECKLREIIPQGSHDMFIADIVATGVDESLIDEKGSLHLGRANLSAFAHGEYFELGKTVGSFGYSVRKKKKKSVKK